MARATTPSYLYQRLIQPGEPVSLERSELRSTKKTAGNKTKKKMEYLARDYGNIPSLEREADFHLRRRSRCGRNIRFSSRIVFSKFFFIFLFMELWDCRHLLCLMQLLTLLLVSLISTCLY